MIIRPVSRPINRSISLAINEPEGSGFDPLSLFAAGEQGVWYDPSDLSTMFQDAAGTIPVTAAGQPVGMLRDKSGRGNHATQPTATSRPILQTEGGKWYLVFDGVDDGMVTAAINFSTSNKMTTWVGALKSSDAAVGRIIELTTSAGNNGSFSIAAPFNVAPDFGLQTCGVAPFVQNVLGPYAAPFLAVISCAFDNAGTGAGASAQVRPRINGVSIAGASGTSVGNYSNAALYIGRRAGELQQFNGRMYGIIARGVASTTQQIADTENYMNSKTGAY